MIPRQRIQNNPPPKEQASRVNVNFPVRSPPHQLLCYIYGAKKGAAAIQTHTRMRDQKSSFFSLFGLELERGVGGAFRDADEIICGR